ncbi:SulP family inorganic anion transporter [Priestia endophytica]|jgi:SulP family sulfate permease|uniref:SulP family inorganic anion transporter n=1 Tax=Priestia endophytica TaxID=135735 RepID=UPI000DCA7E1A|nr:SulP family inorganic anion transporter [Priestia endophytica]KAB2494367.1 SulP family inorganic anion transporter [Priestia endophytica]MBG9814388.1 sulfate transporter [Priestia endophytica]MCM3538926.1 SulP family inorganic anion transporter [Priestia endophytica]MED4069881.1 SulP family inorganic anion transporter [Priestia endophytica]RAS84519.1 sodium-independent anion transporter [Priestia endophytica]
MNTLRKQWFGNIRGDVLAGIVVALALIPEAISFSIIAGVDPMVGLYASFTMAVTISIFGGRPGMISAATGAMALVMGSLVSDHGFQYLLAATILTGVLQILFGVLKLARFMKFVPRSVMIGFVNALAILIFMAQLPHFKGESWPMYALLIGSLAIIYLFPRVTKAIPSPLVAIIVITLVAVWTHADVRTVGDMGTLTSSLPAFFIPDIPLNFETLKIIFPYSLALALVGLLESLLTSQIVDDMTDTESNKNQECKGQGVANIVTGFFGGMAGCAMIGQSVINVKSGGRGRLSTFVAGMFLMFLILVLSNVVVEIPMAALVGVMVMVSIGTFDWSSLKGVTKVPLTDSIVMVVTVISVVATHNLSIGVIIGVILSAIFFAGKISKVHVKENFGDNGEKIYHVEGQLFFVSVTDFQKSFDYKEEVQNVTIDLTNAHIWDDSGAAALDKVVLKFHEQETDVKLVGLNEGSANLLKRLAPQHKL